jgi:hypothetical protein
MNSAGVVRVIQGHPGNLVDELNADLKSNLGTSHYHRLADEELTKRHSFIFQSLSDWLSNRNTSALMQNGETLGRRRLHEGTPLGQVILVLILIEKHLCNFLQSPEPFDEDARKAIMDFFQQFAYYTAKGYERELSESNRAAREAGAPHQTPKKEAAKQTERDMEISRGGQIGEHGG